MNFYFTIKPSPVEIHYTGYKSVTMDTRAFTDLMACYANALRTIRDNFDGDINTSKEVEAILWREQNAQYTYYSGEDV